MPQETTQTLDDVLRRPDLAPDLRTLVEAAQRSAKLRGVKMLTVDDLASYVERIVEQDPKTFIDENRKALARRRNQSALKTIKRT